VSTSAAKGTVSGRVEQRNEDRQRQVFKLLRHFSLVSALAIVVMSAALMLFFRHLSVEDMTFLGERQNEIVARAIENHIRAQFGPLQKLITSAENQAALSKAEAREISDSLSTQIRNLPVLTVRLLNLDGRVIVSSAVDELGSTRSKDAGFVGAREGHPGSRRVATDKNGNSAPSAEKREILASFLPLRNDD